MERFLFILIVIQISFFFSCSEGKEKSTRVDHLKDVSDQKSNDSIRIADSLDAELERLKKSLITNANVVKKLTEFGDSNPETRILMETSLGNMKIKLFEKTPLHRANFVMLAKRGYFDSTIFYRIINKFMIQGGNSDDAEISYKMSTIGSYLIPNEINTQYAHVKGSIAMAVSDEEQQFEKKSSAFNFYIVQGQRLNEEYLRELKAKGKSISAYNQKRYLDVGGAPHLDGDYTVFGEVYEGLGVLKKISKVKTDKYDWPVKPVYIISVKVIN